MSAPFRVAPGLTVGLLRTTRTYMLTPAEQRILAAYCADHPVARCIQCDAEYRPDHLIRASAHDLCYCCPTCGADLSAPAGEHLRTCTVVNVQVADIPKRRLI